eukprot:2571941-Rhodomonas_salina.4
MRWAVLRGNGAARNHLCPNPTREDYMWCKVWPRLTLSSVPPLPCATAVQPSDSAIRELRTNHQQVNFTSNPGAAFIRRIEHRAMMSEDERG